MSRFMKSDMKDKRQQGSIQPIVVVAVFLLTSALGLVLQSIQTTQTKQDLQFRSDSIVRSGARLQAMALDINAVSNDMILALHGLEFMVMSIGSLMGTGMILSLSAAPQGIQLIQESVDFTSELYDLNQQIQQARDKMNFTFAPGLVLGMLEYVSLQKEKSFTIPYPLRIHSKENSNSKQTQQSKLNSPLSSPKHSALSSNFIPMAKEDCIDELTQTKDPSLLIDPSEAQPPVLEIQASQIDLGVSLSRLIYNYLQNPIQKSADRGENWLKEKIAFEERFTNWLLQLEDYILGQLDVKIEDLVDQIPDFYNSEVRKKASNLCKEVPDLMEDYLTKSSSLIQSKITQQKQNRAWKQKQKELAAAMGITKDIRSYLKSGAFKDEVLVFLEQTLQADGVPQAFLALAQSQSDAPINFPLSEIQNTLEQLIGTTFEDNWFQQLRAKIEQFSDFDSPDFLDKYVPSQDFQLQQNKHRLQQCLQQQNCGQKQIDELEIKIQTAEKKMKQSLHEASAKACSKIQDFPKQLDEIKKDMESEAKQMARIAVRAASTQLQLTLQELEKEFNQDLDDLNKQAVRSLQVLSAKALCTVGGGIGRLQAKMDNLPVPTTLNSNFMQNQLLAGISFMPNSYGMNMAVAQAQPQSQHNAPGDMLLVPDHSINLEPNTFLQRPDLLPKPMQSIAKGWVHH